MELFKPEKNFQLSEQQLVVQCPSNIAIVKYWGKFSGQIPANTSISYTLKHCYTESCVHFFPQEPFSVTFHLAGEKKITFSQKIERYFKNIEAYLPFIRQGRYEIASNNTFPHSSGIASSASGFGALAKALSKLESLFSGEKPSQEKASFLARLGSGSACRSLYKGLVVWGQNPYVQRSSNDFAIPYPYEIHPIFKQISDTILLIEEGEKRVSSSVGHELMQKHPFSEQRFQQANALFLPLKSILESGDLEAFGALLEQEALSLHALMLSSSPPYLLMKPNTLRAIQKVWDFRRETRHPLYFTLDAGANLHLFHPKNHSPIMAFIREELQDLAQNKNIIEDEVYF